jgi:hypothetical protein
VFRVLATLQETDKSPPRQKPSRQKMTRLTKALPWIWQGGQKPSREINKSDKNPAVTEYICMQTSRKLKKSVRHSVWQTMKICRTETKSVRPNKINQNQRKTCVCIPKTLLGFHYSAVKIGTVLTANFHILPVIHQRFTVLLPFFIKFCLRSIIFIMYCVLRWRRFSFFLSFGTFSDAILYTCHLDKSRTVGPIWNKKSSDLIKIYRTCPSDRRISRSLMYVTYLCFFSTHLRY